MKHWLKAVDRWQEQEIRAPRLRLTLVLAAAGLLLAVLSIISGADAFSVNQEGQAIPAECALPFVCEGRQVGFLYAPNWGFAALFLWPAMFFVLHGLVSELDEAFAGIDGSPMAWLSAADKKGSVGKTWRDRKRRIKQSVKYIVAAALAVSVIDCWTGSLDYLNGKELSPGVERDWSAVAAGSGVQIWVQMALTVGAFLYQGIALAIMLVFVVTILGAAKTMESHGCDGAKPPLLVDIESNDPGNRLGFERFVVVIDYMIMFVGLAFLNFFLSRVQNAYLRSEGVADLADFVDRDFLIHEIKDIPQLLKLEHLDFTSMVVTFGAFIALFVCFFFFNATLRHVAIKARNRSDHELMKPVMLARAEKLKFSAGDVREKLRTANVWPLGYSDLMPTLSFLTICGAVILFYRVGIYIIFLWIIGWVVARTAGAMLTRKTESLPPKQH